jgi:hypothetical protein
VGILTVRHWGLGVWFDRGDCFEVLFPRAEGVRHPSKGGEYLMAHDPILHVPLANLPAIANPTYEPESVFDLRGCTLDLTGLGVSDPGAILKPSFLIRLDRAPNSVVTGVMKAALSASSCKAHHADLVGRMRLPKGLVYPGAPLEGPITFGPSSDLMTSSVVAVSMRIAGETFHVKIHDELTNSTRIVQLKEDDNYINLTVQNLSVSDRHPTAAKHPPRSEDADFAAHYRLTADPTSPPLGVRVPQYTPKRKTSQQMAALIAPASVLTYPPDILCTASYVDGLTEAEASAKTGQG